MSQDEYLLRHPAASRIKQEASVVVFPGFALCAVCKNKLLTLV